MRKPFLDKALHLLLSSRKYLISFGCVILFLSILKIFYYPADNFSDDAYQDFFNANYKVLNIRIPKNLNFAGEKLPVTDFSVRETMEKELIINTYWQSQSLLLHKRANRWFAVIEPILKRNNIPDDFKYIALIESQLTNVVSPQGATGFWQIIESTGRGYGLEISDEVDERYDVAKSTETACKYFRDAYKQFNNWTLVAASYNLGIGGIQTQLNKQKVTNYYDLLLTEETARYLFRILAMKEIISRPKVYGFELRKKDLYPVIPITQITVDSTIRNLTDFAIAHDANYKILKLFNPWLRTNTLSNIEKKKYVIEFPKNGVRIYDMEGNFIDSDSLPSQDSIHTNFNKDSTEKTEK